MTTRKYSSRSQQTTLTGALTSSGTSATVVSGSGLLGGVTIAAGEIFTVVIDPDTALEEIVDVTAVSTNTLTIVRGIDGSSGQAHSAGAVVRHMAIGRDYREANTHVEATSAVHGVTGSLVGTTDTQTLTNKTLTSPSVTTPTIAGATISGAFTSTATITGGTVNPTTLQQGGVQAVTTTGTQTLTNKTLTSPTLTTPVLGTPSSGTLTNTTGFPAANLAGLGTGVATFLATPSSANLASAVTNETGSGALVFGTSPTIGTPTITSPTVTGLTLNDSSIVFEGSTADAYETTLTVTNPTADRTITLPDATGTVITTGDTGTVTSTMIANSTIVDADISASAAIAKTKLDLGGTITSADLVDGTIVASDIADGTITAAKMVSDPYARANHTGTQASSTISDLASTVKAYTLDEFADPAAAISMNSQKITTLATPTDNADAATKLYVDTKVADLVNSAPSTLDTLGEIASAIQSGGTVYESFVLKAGSTMTGALTLSGAPTVDLHAATKAYVDTVAGSATAAAASAAAAAASYDSFDDRYLGSKSTAPTVDNDGNSLIEGALYWNSVDGAMYAWTGTEWGSISSTAEIYRFRFTASGGETTISGTDDNGLTLSYLPGKEQVYLNGVLLARTSDYTASNGTSITSLAALAASDIVEIITFTSFEVADAIARTVFDAKGDILVGTAADTVGKLTLGTDGYYLQADSTTATGLKWSTVTGYSAPTLGSTSIASGATVTNVNGLTINSTTIPTSKTLVATDSTVTDGTTTTAATGLGYMGVPQNSTTTGAYTIVAADAGKHIYSTATRTITIPANASVAFPVGTAISFVAATGATVTIAITSDTLLLAGAGTTGSRTLSPFGMATAIKITSTSWIISGNGLA